MEEKGENHAGLQGESQARSDRARLVFASPPAWLRSARKRGGAREGIGSCGSLGEALIRGRCAGSSRVRGPHPWCSFFSDAFAPSRFLAFLRCATDTAQYHQYQVVGRHLPTDADPSPTLYRMKIWADDEVKAKSKFWYFIKRLKRVKKENGQIIAVNEIFEKFPTIVKNYGVWLRVLSRTGYYNMYKEYRDVTMNGAIDQMYNDLAARHRIRSAHIQIIKTATLKDEECKRPNVLQLHGDDIKFPQPQKSARPSEKKFRSIFKASRPNVSLF